MHVGYVLQRALVIIYHHVATQRNGSQGIGGGGGGIRGLLESNRLGYNVIHIMALPSAAFHDHACSWFVNNTHRTTTTTSWSQYCLSNSDKMGVVLIKWAWPKILCTLHVLKALCHDIRRNCFLMSSLVQKFN